MKIIVVGASGTIGRAAVKELGKRHELLKAGRKGEDLQVDIGSIDSIKKMYHKAGPVDAVVCAFGDAVFETIEHMNEEKYKVGLQSKLMGQISLVLQGMASIRDGGSFTLISGILSRDPILSGTSAAMVNGAIDGFVKSAAIEFLQLRKKIRINAVSPTILEETFVKHGENFRGFPPVSAEIVGMAYSKSVEGAQTGKIYYAGGMPFGA